MICAPCRKGGHATQLANDETDRDDIRESLQRLARRSHERCQHPATCPCHHYVGQALNKQPVRG